MSKKLEVTYSYSPDHRRHVATGTLVGPDPSSTYVSLGFFFDVTPLPDSFFVFNEGSTTQGKVSDQRKEEFAPSREILSTIVLSPEKARNLAKVLLRTADELEADKNSE